MTTLTAKQTASWVRVRLAAPSDEPNITLTEGELVLRADRVAVEDEYLVFLLSDEPVFRLERRYFRALTWFVDRPTFGEWLKARRSQYPNSHKPWSGDECDRLTTEIQLYGMGWQQIADAHGRTPSSVRRQAQRLGLIGA